MRVAEIPFVCFSCQNFNISMVYCERVVLLKQFTKDDDWPFYVLLIALSFIRFILSLRLRLWNTQLNGQYPNCSSIKAFITILSFVNVCERCKVTKSIMFLTHFFTEIIDMIIEFQVSVKCYIKSISFVFDSMDKSSISVVDGSRQFQRS